MRVLYATDGSAGAAVALDLLLDLPLSAEDHVACLSVPVHHTVAAAEPGGFYTADLYELEVADARARADEARGRVRARGLSASAHWDDGSVAATIIAVARREKCALVVVGTRGLGGFGALVLGSVARSLTRHSPVPVLAVRERRVAPRRIVAAVDGSADAEAALRTLRQLPLPADARVTLLHVVPELPGWPPKGVPPEVVAAVERELARQATDVLERSVDMLGGRFARAEVAERGHVAERILERVAAEGADLVVVGARGARPSPWTIQGSVADAILAGARCAVLVARAVSPRVRAEKPAELVAATA